MEQQVFLNKLKNNRRWCIEDDKKVTEAMEVLYKQWEDNTDVPHMNENALSHFNKRFKRELMNALRYRAQYDDSMYVLVHWYDLSVEVGTLCINYYISLDNREFHEWVEKGLLEHFKRAVESVIGPVEFKHISQSTLKEI